MSQPASGRRSRKARAIIACGIAAVAAGATLSLMLPVEAWRTGEPRQRLPPLSPAEPLLRPGVRVWVDTDAACGTGRRTDPDDCLALLLLGRSRAELAGISTVFGNADLRTTDAVTRDLAALLAKESGKAVPVVTGSAAPGDRSAPAHLKLRAALADGPLVIIALGPLTNVATALEGRPRLHRNVVRLVAVAGRRRGHLFHSVEGGTARTLLGHGPVFRDFNFSKDPAAAEALLSTGIPITLIPYEAARDVSVGDPALDAMTSAGGAAAWVAARSRAWLDYWQSEIGVPGFYPFDMVAAAYVLRPSLLACVKVKAWVDDDVGILGLLGGRGLFVDADEPAGSTSILYCPQADPRIAQLAQASG